MSSSILQPDEHVLTTLEKDGSRRWLFPKLSRGYYWRVRQLVGFLLIAVFVIIPHLKSNGKPLFLLDITQRKFILFGTTFLPTDTLMMALLMVSLFLGIFLLTAIFGRVWCGWACPQTVYLEFVYRPIERFFLGTTGRGGVPSKKVAPWRYAAMYFTFFVISLGLAHTFLAYFVGVDRLQVWVTQSPLEHPGPFVVMAFTTVLMMFDFCFFREQMCLIACPYGRFQSVLLDRNSLIVAYDRNRGEPRGHVSKSLPVVDNQLGDCVDCGLCVKTCPTGIDIRDGLQMECIHCTQCIDACNDVMTRVNRPLGLIRYSSQNQVDGQKSSMIRARVVIYPLMLTIFLGLFFWNLSQLKSFNATLLRNFGLPFTVTEEGLIANSLRIRIVNRLETEDQFTISVVSPPEVKMDVENPVTIAADKDQMVSVYVTAPKSSFKVGQISAEFLIQSQAGDQRKVQCLLLGP